MNLLEAMNLELNRAKKYLGWILFLSGILYLITVAEFFYAESVASVTLSLTFVIQCCIFVFKYKTESHYFLGSEIRQIVILKDSLGLEPAPIEMAKLNAKVGRTEKVKTYYESPYYDSTLPTGPSRLLENIAESAFFTNYQTKALSVLIFTLTVIGAIFLVVCIFLLMQMKSVTEWLPLVSKIFILTVTALGTGDLMLLGVKYFVAGSETSDILNQCETLMRENEINRDNALIAFNDYNFILASTPPIPNWFYCLCRDRLNKAWKTRNIFS